MYVKKNDIKNYIKTKRSHENKVYANKQMPIMFICCM